MLKIILDCDDVLYSTNEFVMMSYTAQMSLRAWRAGSG